MLVRVAFKFLGPNRKSSRQNVQKPRQNSPFGAILAPFSFWRLWRQNGLFWRVFFSCWTQKWRNRSKTLNATRTGLWRTPNNPQNWPTRKIEVCGRFPMNFAAHRDLWIVMAVHPVSSRAQHHTPHCTVMHTPLSHTLPRACSPAARHTTQTHVHPLHVQLHTSQKDPSGLVS